MLPELSSSAAVKLQTTFGIDSNSFEENYKMPVLNKTTNNFLKYQETNIYNDFFADSEKKSYYLK